MLSYHNHPGTIGSHIQAPLNIVLWKRRYIKCNTLLLHYYYYQVLFVERVKGEVLITPTQHERSYVAFMVLICLGALIR